MRVGDHERKKVITRLGQARAQGYLSLPEWETRLDRALEAQTAGTLNETLADLPIKRIARSDPAAGRPESWPRAAAHGSHWPLTWQRH